MDTYQEQERSEGKDGGEQLPYNRISHNDGKARRRCKHKIRMMSKRTMVHNTLALTKTGKRNIYIDITLVSYLIPSVSQSQFQIH